MHIGETRIMNCGLRALIINYHTATNIDVEFENGTIVCHKTYSNFLRGQIAPPKNRIGEENIATCGMKMQVVAYRSATDIDIQFKDDTIVRHKCYSAFKAGQIAYPNIMQQRIGESNIATNGLKMDIIAYRTADDIDIQFEDGVIVKHRCYQQFQKGNIKHPNIYRTKRQNKQINERIGQLGVTRTGVQIKIIAYRNATDIDIQFPDGAVAEHKTYANFMQGIVKHPSVEASNRINQTGMSVDGLKMTIIAYRSSVDMDVQFENGVIVEHIRYESFKSGHVYINSHSNKAQNLVARHKYLGMERVANNGMKMKIIAYRNRQDIDIQFEDGMLCTHRQLVQFLNGTIMYPNRNLSGASYNELICACFLEPLGFTKYRKSKNNEIKGLELDLWHPDLRVAIEYDGYIRNQYGHTLTNDMKKNKIVHKAGILLYRIRQDNLPNLPADSLDSSINYILHGHSQNLVELKSILSQIIADINSRFNTHMVLPEMNVSDIEAYINYHIVASSRIGETMIASNGMRMTITAYRRHNDIDVLFDDGVLAKHKYYSAFKRGQIAHPIYSAIDAKLSKQKAVYNGIKRQANNGMNMQIVDFIKSDNITVQFDDGVLVKHARLYDFLKGKIAHPGIQTWNRIKRNQYENTTAFASNGMKMTLIKYRNNQDVDVMFEDGVIVQHKTCANFKKGYIRHPNTTSPCYKIS